MKNPLQLLAIVATLLINAHAVNSQSFQVQRFSTKQYGSNGALVVNHEGEILLGTNQGVFTHNGTAFTPLYNSSNGLSGDSVISMAKDPAGSLWIETEKGISIKKV